MAGEKPGSPRRRWKLIICTVVIFLALVWLVLFLSVGGDFYRTVEEIQKGGAAQNIRVGGRVSPGSLKQDGDTVRFVLTGDSGAELPVVYRGPYPERLGPYEEVVAAGSETAAGIFEATEVLVKCPSKFLPETAFNKALSGAGLERFLY
jgi:cytochrome c-type biogenesis protein CcmE